jgi:hypothetical protein
VDFITSVDTTALSLCGRDVTKTQNIYNDSEIKRALEIRCRHSRQGCAVGTQKLLTPAP